MADQEKKFIEIVKKIKNWCENNPFISIFLTGFLIGFILGIIL